MKKVNLLALAMLLALGGCILSSSPGASSVSMHAGESLTFSIKVLPSNASIVWYLDGQKLDDVTGRAFTYAPEDGDIGNHLIRVTESSPFFGSASRSWSVSVLESEYGLIESQEQAQQALYAAYAGIGYGAAANPNDDAPLYDALFEDLNLLSVQMVLTTLTNDPDLVTKLAAVLLGQTKTFVYTDNGLTTTLTVNPGTTNIITKIMPFAGSLRVDVPESGYTFGGCTYSGVADNDDILATVTGTVNTSDLAGALQTLRIGTVNITATETLTASYPDVFIAAYDGWQISYAVDYAADHPVNMSILPINFSGTVPAVDFRDYTLKGGFALDDQAYDFSDGVRYIQQQWDYNEGGTLVTRTLLSIEGDLSVPGLDGLVTIETAFDVRDPLGGGTILRAVAGDWEAGGMTISDRNGDVAVTFALNAADFSDSELGDWSVADWQDTLAP